MFSISVLNSNDRSLAQGKQLVQPCGTVQVLEHTFETNPLLKATFNKQTAEFQRSVGNRKTTGPSLRIEGSVIYIPVVFKTVGTNAKTPPLNEPVAFLMGGSPFFTASQ